MVADGVRVSRVGATRLLRSLPALALAWPALAGAGPVAEPLASARAGLAEGDLKGAVKTVDAAVKALPEAAAVVEPAELAALFMVQGAAWHRRGEKYESKAMDSFRRALSTDGEVAWDRERLGEGADWTLFEALRDEVRSRPEVDPKVPEKTGAAQVFIDGVRVRAGDAVIQGTHLGQITCDDATVHGVWTALDKPVDWLALCPGGVDTSVVVADAPEDEWDGFGPDFGDADGGTDEPVAAAAPAPAPPPPARRPPRGVGVGVGPVALMAGGGALVLGGSVTYFALVSPRVDAALAAAGAPASVTRAQANTLTAEAEAAQGLTLGLVGGGVALAAGGLTWTLLADAPVRPVVGPRTLGLVGSF